MNELNIALVAVGGLVLLIGLVSDLFRRTWWTSEPLTALVCGILLGPTVFGLLHPDRWGVAQETLIEQAARLTLAIGLMGVALRLPKNYAFRKARSLLVLLLPVMLLMWLCSGVLVYLILNLPFWEAMLAGAAITPTDPIAASSIVTGVVARENLPGRLRYILSAESGWNDGLGYPFVLLAILMLQRSPTEAISHWFTRILLWEVGAAILFGALLGYLAGRLLEWAENKHTIESKSFLGYTIALSITVLGAAKLIGTDGILAVFVAGLIFSDVVRGDEKAEEENVQEAINRFFTLPIFILLGLVLPWQQWWALGWKGLILVLSVLLLRRLPAILLLHRLIKPLKNTPDVLFMGWFGPIGVAALYYAGLSLHKTGVEAVWTVTSLVICASLIAHGLTSTSLTKLYGRYNQNQQVNRESG
ncbi:cation:proton antiporter [Gloeocapsopsis crepidinum LEGE 06123]|uniref:Cation:proton antiporter n=1 Tax=Gloeocapsopsis crepidinum LEGE 06123 TaxID=588587 RepID=A0ABR9UV08_9CHRO|nr:cation:proton antiporter [Gloeocapsopsis crepidinum]MBE9191878.1 cation:proton antiporter [Gloeocapsopsis crepidinum LEGE 06123]